MENPNPLESYAPSPLPTDGSINTESASSHVGHNDAMLGAPSITPSAHYSPSQGMADTTNRLPVSSPAKLRRTPSASSLLRSTSTTPTLHKRSSLSSLKGSNTGRTPPRSPISAAPTRRASSQFVSSNQGVPAAIEEHAQPVTAMSVAKEYFERDLSSHNSKLNSDSQGGNGSSAGSVVIIHDACYGHRYSRPKTTKTNLSTIVERPERIHAAILGISSAYVLLGGRYTGGTNAPNPKDNHADAPFIIKKSMRRVSLLSQAVTQVHGSKWMAELKMMCEGAEGKLAMNGKELVRPSAQPGVGQEKEKPELHEGDLYLCGESLDALEGALGGVLDAVDIVFDTGGPRRAFTCVRPPGHHCSEDFPSGFCWLNNVHVGISHASAVHGLTHAAIIDFDLHHGDGSQSISWDHNAKINSAPKNTSTSKKPPIGYFSLHDINSYPCEYGDEEKVQNASLCIENAHGQTIWNVHLQPWKSDAEFWTLYQNRYMVLLEKTRTFLRHHSDRIRAQSHNSRTPRAAVFISAGFDASEWESQGMQRHKVNVPTDFYARFTQDIIALSLEEGLGVDGRVISVLEGGYSDRALMSGVLSHMCGLVPPSSGESVVTVPTGLGEEMSRRIGQLDLGIGTAVVSKQSLKPKLDDVVHWWSPSRLEELESQVNPPASVTVAPKKPRGPIKPTYVTPTQSFTAKIVSPANGHRSNSMTVIHPRSTSSASSRPPSPTLPTIDWAVASHELSKLLIPTDRQTRSCRPEDLNVEATKARRSRQSMVAVAASTESIVDPNKHMQLRDRRSKMTNQKSDEELEVRPPSKASRRRTVAGAASLEKETKSEAAGAAHTKLATKRRASMASTVLSAIDDTSELTHEISKLEALTLNRSTPDPSTTANVQMPATKALNPPKVRAPRKAPARPPVPRIPSSAKASSAKTTSSRPTSLPASEQQPDRAGSNDVQDIDDLATGMKKMSIKLNMPPKPEAPPRESKRKTAPKAPKRQPVPKLVKVSSMEPASDPVPKTFTPAATVPPILDSRDQILEQDDQQLSDGRFSSKLVTGPTNHQSLPVGVDLSEPASVFIEGIHEVDGLSNAGRSGSGLPASLDEHVQSLPTHISTVAEHTVPPYLERKLKHDLPVFTSESPIVFGQASTQKPNAIMTTSQKPVKLDGTGLSASLDRKEFRFSEIPHSSEDRMKEG